MQEGAFLLGFMRLQNIIVVLDKGYNGHIIEYLFFDQEIVDFWKFMTELEACPEPIELDEEL